MSEIVGLIGIPALEAEMRDRLKDAAIAASGRGSGREAMSEEELERMIEDYKATILFEHPDGSYYSVEDTVFDEGRERAADEIMALIKAALASKP